MMDPASIGSTSEGYLAREREAPVRSEYVNGDVIAMAGGTHRRSRLTVRIAFLLETALGNTSCEVFNGDMKGRVAETDSYFYPDLSVTCGETEFQGDAVLVNPLAIVEVLSPSTANDDRGEKFDHYQRIPSLRDYVIVFQDRPRVEVFSRQRSDQWLLTITEGLEASVTIPSLELELALRELYARVAFPSVAPPHVTPPADLPIE